MKKIISKIKPEIRYILVLFFISRLGLVLIGVLSRIALEPFHGKEYVWRYSKYLWLDIWGVWDSGYYLNIAKFGYSALISTRVETLGQANYAFFPLYPTMVHYLGELLNGNYFLAGIILSNLFFLAAVYLFYKLIILEESEEIAKDSVKYLFLFPTAFVFSGVFTESLFLFLLVAVFYFSKRKNWLWVGLLGFLLSLCRFVGVLVLIPILWEYLKSVDYKIAKIKLNIFYLTFFPLGLFSFAFYNFRLTGNFLAFMKIQSAWGRELVNPLKLIYSNLFFGNVYEVFLASFSVILLGVIILSYQKINFSYWLWAMIGSLTPLLTGLASMPRYFLVIFPLYLILAKVSQNKLIGEGLTILLALIQGFLMVFWANGFEFVM